MSRVQLYWAEAAAAIAVLAAAAGAAASSERATSVPPLPRADSDVLALATSGSILYLGGDFTKLGERSGQFAVVGRRSPAVLGGPVDAVASDGRGGWFVGGRFSSVAGVSCPRLAHVRADGALDRRWCVAPDSTVWELTVAGSRLYVGGEFGTIAGASRSAAAALDLATAKLLPWHPRFRTAGCGGGEEYAPGGASIWELAASRSTVFVGGCFQEVGGQKRDGLAAVDAATGKPTRWQPRFAHAAGAWTLAPSGDALFIVGLWLKYVVGSSHPEVTRQRLAAVDARTGRVKRWYPTPRGEIDAIAVSGSTIYLGGEFNRIGGMPRRNLAAVDARSGAVTRWRPDPDFTIDIIVPAGRRVFVAGRFVKRIGGPGRVGLAAVDASTGRVTRWTSDTSGGSVRAVAVSSDGSVAVGFEEGGVRGSARNHLAAIDGATGRITAWNPNPDGEVEALTISDSTLYLAGDFERIGGQRRNGLAAIDLRSGEVTPWNPKTSGGWERIAIRDQVVFVARQFDGAGRSNPRLSAIDAATGMALPWKLAPLNDYGSVSLVIAGSTLFVGGVAVESRQLRAFDAATGRPKEFAVPLAEEVSSLAASDGTLYLATCCSGGRVLAVDAATGRVKWSSEHILTVTAMVVWDNVLYLGGLFDRVAGKERNGLAALDAATGELKPWRAEIDGGITDVNALNIAGSRLYVGGDFDGHLAAFALAGP